MAIHDGGDSGSEGNAVVSGGGGSDRIETYMAYFDFHLLPTDRPIDG